MRHDDVSLTFLFLTWTLWAWSQNTVTGFKPLNTRTLIVWSQSRVSRHRFTATAMNARTIFEDTHSSHNKHSEDTRMIFSFVLIEWDENVCGCVFNRFHQSRCYLWIMHRYVHSWKNTGARGCEKVINRIQGTDAYLRPNKNKPPCELVISRNLAN